MRARCTNPRSLPDRLPPELHKDEHHRSICTFGTAEGGI